MRRSGSSRGLAILLAVSTFAGLPTVALAKSKHRKEAPPAEVAPPPEPAPESAPPPPEPPKTSAPALAAGPGAASGNRISYGPPGPGMGAVTIKGDRVQVVFDGRSFGVTPVTIHDVPKGDYIVEGTTADGRSLTRPVTVDESAEVTVELNKGLTGPLDLTAVDADDGSFRLPFTSKLLLGVGAGSLAVGALFGILELKAHHDYENATTQSAIDSLSRTGLRDARIANIAFVTAGASVLAAGLVALPAYLRSERPAAVPTAVVVATGSHVVALAGLSVGV